MTYTVYEDNYIILETSASAAVEVDVDLLFDRFRWAELSLGFASTGNSLNEEVSSGCSDHRFSNAMVRIE